MLETVKQKLFENWERLSSPVAHGWAKTKDTAHAVKTYPYWKSFKTLLIETPAEIYIGAAALGAAAGITSFEHEDSKLGQIPVAYSEYENVSMRLGWKGQKPNVLTTFYSVANDVPMQVFEANNLGYTWDHSTQKFAYEVEKKVEHDLRVSAQISDYAPQAPKMAHDALVKLAPWARASHDIKPVIEALDNAWDEEHIPRYHTEVYTTTVCSSNGKTTSCHPEVRTRQVYDYTDHYYTYHSEWGKRAAALMQDFSRKHPDIRINEDLLRVTMTTPDNEWAIRESRKHTGEHLYEKDYMRLVNTWKTGSNYETLGPKVYEGHTGVLGKTPEWNVAKRTAHDEHIRTYARTIEGPQEFQIAEAALDYAVEMSRNIDRTTDGVVFAGKNIPVLSQKIQDFVNVALHGKGEGDQKQMRSEIMALSREIYNRNYTGGFDTEPAKYGMVVLWTFLGMLAGAGLGYAADRVLANSSHTRNHYRQQHGRRESGFNYN